MSQHVFWIGSRAAGIICLLAASAAVGVGLLMSGRLGAKRTPDMRIIHEALSLVAMGALVLHAGLLLFDAFLSPSVFAITVPFVSAHERLWTSVGIVSGWTLIVLGLSYYARARIGVARWRKLHRWTALAWVGGVLHSLGEGTDAGQAWFLISVGLVVLPSLVLLAAPRRKLVTS